VPLCVCAAVVVPVALTATLALDPRREPAPILAAARAAATSPAGPLGALTRGLGQPLDRSDVVVVLHDVPGVTGVATLTLSGLPGTGAAAAIGRLPAEPYQLLVVETAAVSGAAT
jgi:hypothetical protein